MARASMRERLKHPAEYLLLRVLACCVQALSPRMCTRGAHWLATFVHYCLPRKNYSPTRSPATTFAWPSETGSTMPQD